jgi:hypothetical protein
MPSPPRVLISVAPSLFDDALARVLRSHGFAAIRCRSFEPGCACELHEGQPADVVISSVHPPRASWRCGAVLLPPATGGPARGLIITPDAEHTVTIDGLASLIDAVHRCDVAPTGGATVC